MTTYKRFSHSNCVYKDRYSVSPWIPFDFIYRDDGDHDNNIKYDDDTLYFADEMGKNELFSTRKIRDMSSFKLSLPGNGYQQTAKKENQPSISQ